MLDVPQNKQPFFVVLRFLRKYINMISALLLFCYYCSLYVFRSVSSYAKSKLITVSYLSDIAIVLIKLNN